MKSVLEHHPDRRQLLVYLAAEVDTIERSSIEQHVADCDHCRARLVDLHVGRRHRAADEAPSVAPSTLQRARALGASRHRRGPTWLLAATLAVAVLGLLAAWAAINGRQTPGGQEPERAKVYRIDDAVHALTLLAPADGAALPPEPVELRWTPVLSALGYRVWGLDAAGVPFIEHETDMASWTLPTEGRAGSVFWYVEAELEDGSHISSSAWRFDLVSDRGETVVP